MKILSLEERKKLCGENKNNKYHRFYYALKIKDSVPKKLINYWKDLHLLNGREVQFISNHSFIRLNPESLIFNSNIFFFQIYNYYINNINLVINHNKNILICDEQNPAYIIKNFNFLVKKSLLLKKSLKEIIKNDLYIDVYDIHEYTNGHATSEVRLAANQESIFNACLDEFYSDSYFDDNPWLRNEYLLYPDEKEIADILE